MTLTHAATKKAPQADISSSTLHLLELSGRRIHSMNPDGSDRKTVAKDCRSPDGNGPVTGP